MLPMLHSSTLVSVDSSFGFLPTSLNQKNLIMVQGPILMYHLYIVKTQGPFDLDFQTIMPHKDFQADLYQQ